MTAVSDPLPQILEGIPLRARSIRVDLDRPGFTLNPTNCDPFSVDATISGDEGGAADASDPVPGGQLRRPRRSSRSSSIKLRRLDEAPRPPGAAGGPDTAQPGEANISKVTGRRCRRASCSTTRTSAPSAPGSSSPPTPARADSVYGTATATTPLLDQPLTGNVYLRASDHKLPDLVADLAGPVRHRGLRPDRQRQRSGPAGHASKPSPTRRSREFVLELAGGKKGLLVNSENLCKAEGRPKQTMVGQNGAVVNRKAKLQAACGSKALESAQAPAQEGGALGHGDEQGRADHDMNGKDEGSAEASSDLHRGGARPRASSSPPGPPRRRPSTTTSTPGPSSTASPPANRSTAALAGLDYDRALAAARSSPTRGTPGIDQPLHAGRDAGRLRLARHAVVPDRTEHRTEPEHRDRPDRAARTDGNFYVRGGGFAEPDDHRLQTGRHAAPVHLRSASGEGSCGIAVSPRRRQKSPPRRRGGIFHSTPRGRTASSADFVGPEGIQPGVKIRGGERCGPATWPSTTTATCTAIAVRTASASSGTGIQTQARRPAVLHAQSHGKTAPASRSTTRTTTSSSSTQTSERTHRSSNCTTKTAASSAAAGAKKKAHTRASATGSQGITVDPATHDVWVASRHRTTAAGHPRREVRQDQPARDPGHHGDRARLPGPERRTR